MKIKIIVVVLALLFSTLFLFFNIDYPYRENVLYSQRDVKNYNENQSGSSNLINRNEAIKIAKYYIEDILGNDLDSDDTGNEHAIEKLKQGYNVFLWKGYYFLFI